MQSSFEKKPTYTVSALSTFLRCEKEYELRYGFNMNPVGGKPENPQRQLAAEQWGELVHEMMQFLDLKTYSNLQTVIEQTLLNQQITDPDQKIFERLKSLSLQLKNTPQIQHILETADTFFHEISFLYDGKDFYIRGTLDRLSQHNGEWIVLDYKTDKITNEYALKQRSLIYEGQLACYAVATSQILGIKKLSTALLFTDGPFLMVQDWDETKLKDAYQMLALTHQSLSLTNYSYRYPADQERCHHCPYYEKNYCGVRS